MKLLSILMILQGLVYELSAINSLTKSNMFKYGAKYYSYNFHYIGIFIGILFIVTGIGIWIDKRKAYYVGLILYISLIVYGFTSMVYFSITDGFEFGMFISSLTVLVFFSLISRYIYKKIQNY